MLRGQIPRNDTAAQGQLDQIDNIISYQLKRAATAGHKALQAQIVVYPIVERITNALKKVYVDKKINYINSISESLVVPIDEGDLMELLGNIIDNAAKNGCKTVKISEDQSLRAIVISDDGPGFPMDAKSLLQRGIRADTRTPGQGIGLAVANDIALAYGMELRLGNSKAGAKVVLSPSASFISE